MAHSDGQRLHAALLVGAALAVIVVAALTAGVARTLVSVVAGEGLEPSTSGL